MLSILSFRIKPLIKTSSKSIPQLDILLDTTDHLDIAFIEESVKLDFNSRQQPDFEHFRDKLNEKE